MGTQLSPSSGSLAVLGKTPTQLGAREIKQLRTRIAMIPQYLGLVYNISALRNVLNGGLGEINLLRTVRQMIRPSRKETLQVYDLLERAGIGEKIYYRIVSQRST